MIKKRSFSLLVLLTLFAGTVVNAQKEQVLSDVQGGSHQVGQSKKDWIALHPENDRTQLVDILGIAGQSFSVANATDGSANGMGYNRTEHIELALVTNVKDTAYRILFYSDRETFQQVVSTAGTVRTVYFPAYMYADIKQKLDQALLQKKKAQLKIVLRKEGYTEASLQF